MRAKEFFAYLRERENVRLRKEAGDFFPWTSDPILREYKFTNVHRHHDKTSRELRRLFYTPNAGAKLETILMNCALARYFGTWEFAQAVGWQEYDAFDFDFVEKLAARRLAQGKRVFTGAYVITNQGISAPKEQVVVRYFLQALWEKTPSLVAVARQTQSWKLVADQMRMINGFGGSGFMTKEILLDTTYTDFWKDQSDDEGPMSHPEDWMNWTPIGPGARRGAARLLGRSHEKPTTEGEAGLVIANLLDESRSSMFWPSEWSPLCPHDIQFALCEFDKYERVRLGQGKPRSKYRQ